MNQLSQEILIDRYARKGEYSITDVFRRVAGDVATSHKESIEFFDAMNDGYFIPAGRILAATKERTMYNCFVLPSPHDSRGGIADTLKDMIETHSRGGGVGMNVSSLRPRGAAAKKVGGTSSGAVSWAALYSFATGLVEQAGSRRGATMICLHDWHPDVKEFIHSKREAGKITNANISVLISDAFMQAVKDDLDWELVFPDTEYPNYDELWDGDLDKWKESNRPVVHYERVRARDLWREIMESAWASAEPGVLFYNRANDMSNAWYFSRLESTNPCSEQWLSRWGVCLLGHIQLQNMLKEADDGKQIIDWVRLKNTVRTAVRFLDNIIDINPYHNDENERVQKSERRIGLGTMGFAELLIKKGIRYGSDESVGLARYIQKFIAVNAYEASSDLALEHGSFSMFDSEKFLASGFMQKMPEDLREKIRKDGIRNVCLMSQAPTGTVGTMMNTSTGIEPFFSFSHWRKTRMGTFEEKHPIVEGFNGDEEFLVCAMDGTITPEEHVKVMAAFQEWTDNSISKTVNLPNSATVEDVAEAYESMYALGCKGGTVYRDGSRDEQILNLATECPECEEEALIKEAGCSTCHACGYSYCDM